MNTQILCSVDNSHCIELIMNRDECYFTILDIEHNKYKTFAILLKEMMEIMYKNNINKIILNIVNDEVKLFEKKDIIENDDEYTTISINTEDFINEITNVHFENMMRL